jgi:hypothetical protein
VDLQPGDVFAGHRIEGVAGRGGMGVVYRAVQLALDRVVALKTIAPSLAADPAFRARFVRESRAAAAIDHPNVLPVFDAGAAEDVLYIVMRYVDGEDLRSAIRAGGRLPVARAATIVSQVAGALDAAHARGLVHRDVKPANVLLDRNDHAYLTDFGLTKRLHSSAGTEVTHAGGWVGTLGYVAPEQIRDEPIDGRADVYALGCVLVHTLTGRPPFERSSDEATLWAHLHDDPPELPGDAPPELVDALGRALAKRPEERWHTAGDFGRAVLAAIGRPVDTEETRITPPDRRPDATRPLAAPAPSPAPAEHGPAGDTAATGYGPAADRTAATGPGPPAGRTAATTAAPSRPRRSLLLGAGAALLLAGGAAAAVAVLSGDDDGGATTATTAPPPTSGPRVVVDSVEVGSRPTGLAIARGAAFVARPRSSRLTRVDLEAFERSEPSFRVGRGTTDVDAGLGALWATSDTTVERLTRVDLDDGSRRTAELPDGTPVAVEVTSGAVWVGIRGSATQPLPVSSVARVDPRTLRVERTVAVPDGVQDLAVGAGGVWVSNRRTPTITRIDIASGRQQKIAVGRRPGGIALGGGAVWVAGTEEGVVRRIDRRDPADTAIVSVGGQPRGVAYGGGALWAASFADSALTRLSGRNGRRIGDRVDVSLNPLKLVVHRGTTYAISLAEGRLDRVRSR